MRDSRIRLLPWVFDGKAFAWPRTRDTRLRQPRVGDAVHALQRQRVLLGATSQGASPQVGDPQSEGPECWAVRGQCVVREVPLHLQSEPAPLLGYGLVHAPSQLHLNVLEFGPHAVGPRLSP